MDETIEKEEKKIDLVYILGTGSVWEDNELRYSLRSVVSNLENIGNVFIVGEFPEWLDNVAHIEGKDEFDEKWKNGFHKILLACQDERVSEEFLLMNDDFFISQKMSAVDFPYLYHKDLKGGAQKISGKSNTTKKQTAFLLQKENKSTLDYSLHYPIRINKSEYLEMPISLEMEESVSPRSFYANYFEKEGQSEQEYNISPSMTKDQIEKFVKNALAFSIFHNTGASLGFRNYIKATFPEKSRFEK